ncbi:MAG: iron ABC transporter substrate-binding protein [Deltaproteobacteria bacterium]|nr:iron ABC transporter substrate-binding protein [Deltaproteobacteria bacterium]
MPVKIFLKTTKIILFFLFSLLFTVAAQAREIVDLAGRNLTVPDTVERIVALGPGTLRLVVYLQALDKVVAVESLEKRGLSPFFRPYSEVCAKELTALPEIGSGGPGKLPELEALLAARPQVLFAIGLDRGQCENLTAKTGIPTVILSYGKLGVWRAEAQQSLALMGEILERQERAVVLSRFLEKSQAELRQKSAAAGPAPTAYFGGLAYKGGRGLESTEAGYFPGTLVQARNVAGSNPDRGHLFVDKERLLQWNPEIIFLDYSSTAQISRDYLANPDFYQLLQAVNHKQLFMLLPYNQYNTNLENALANAYYIAGRLYPEKFTEAAVTTKIAEIFNFFLGLKIDRTSLPAYHSFSLQRVAGR